MQGNANSSDTKSQSKGVEPYKKAAFDQFLTYCALGGLLVSEIGGLRIMTIKEFCEEVGVEESTTWRWKKNTPDFAMRVRQRREEIVPLARETAAWNKLYLIGMTSIPTGEKIVYNSKTGAPKIIKTGAKHDDQRAAVDALKTYLGHYGEMRLPTQRQEIKHEGNFLDMMSAAAREGLIEGEVVDAVNTGPQADTAGSGQNPGALPPAS